MTVVSHHCLAWIGSPTQNIPQTYLGLHFAGEKVAFGEGSSSITRMLNADLPKHLQRTQFQGCCFTFPLRCAFWWGGWPSQSTEELLRGRISKLVTVNVVSSGKEKYRSLAVAPQTYSLTICFKIQFGAPRQVKKQKTKTDGTAHQKIYLHKFHQATGDEEEELPFAASPWRRGSWSQS